MARGSNSRDGRTARSELGREDRRDIDGEPRASGRIQKKEAPLRPYTNTELDRLVAETDPRFQMKREDFVKLRSRDIRIEKENGDLFKRLQDGKPQKEDFGSRDAGVNNPSQPFFTRSGYQDKLLQAGAFIKMKNGEVFEVKEALRSRKDKEGEEGWDGSERVLYVQDLGGGNAQEYRIDDLSKIDAVIPRDWQNRLEGGRVARSEVNYQSEVKDALKLGKFDPKGITLRSRLIPRMETYSRQLTRERQQATGEARDKIIAEEGKVSDLIQKLKRKQGGGR